MANVFVSSQAKECGRRFREQSVRTMNVMFRSMGVSSIDDIYRQIEENETRARTCTKCGLICNDYGKLAQHVDTENCCKRQANALGEAFVPKRERRKHCETCNKSILFYNWVRHVEGGIHLENLRREREPAFMCTVCNKIFDKGNRQKRMLKHHMQSKKHLAKLELPYNMSKHNSLLRKHFCKVITV
jgi:uncharacterized protein with PIN domain